MAIRIPFQLARGARHRPTLDSTCSDQISGPTFLHHSQSISLHSSSPMYPLIPTPLWRSRISTPPSPSLFLRPLELVGLLQPMPACRHRCLSVTPALFVSIFRITTSAGMRTPDGRRAAVPAVGWGIITRRREEGGRAGPAVRGQIGVIGRRLFEWSGPVSRAGRRRRRRRWRRERGRRR